MPRVVASRGRRERPEGEGLNVDATDGEKEVLKAVFDLPLVSWAFAAVL